MKVLVTGGAGYIGAITASALERAGHTPVILDSLLSGPAAFVADRCFYRGDIADRGLLRRIVDEHSDIGATIHLAARIVVSESLTRPYEYYRDNVTRSLELFDELRRLGKPRIIFSSSASVYAATEDFEVFETSPTGPQSPYARSKRMTELILADLAATGGLSAVILRYFNPIGSDPDLRFGVYVREPTHVLGQLLLAARGQREAFPITGTDYPTRDGTGLRDYVHVWDLARAHVAALVRFDSVLKRAAAPTAIVNLGTGQGVTVRELVAAVESVLGRSVPTQEAPRRAGDAVGAYANVDRARDWLGWSTEYSLLDGVASAIAWAERREHVLGYL